MVSVFGILNVTRDSFSDGGRFLDSAAAIARGLELAAAGADVVDVGAESSHPDAEAVPAAVEIARLEPVVRALVAAGVQVSIDTSKPEVMAAMTALGATFLNDVSGFRSAAAVAAAAASSARLVVMFARGDAGRAVGLRAARAPTGPALPDGGNLLGEIEQFFTARIAALGAAGIARSRLVLDPGMGLFLGEGPESSLLVLRALGRLRRFGLPLLVSVSRKSFLGALTGRAVPERGAATLAAELWAAQAGVDWIRTHDVAALRDGLRVWRALAEGATPADPRTAQD